MCPSRTTEVTSPQNNNSSQAPGYKSLKDSISTLLRTCLCALFTLSSFHAIAQSFDFRHLGFDTQGFRVEIQGTQGEEYRLEASSDLLNWTEIQTLTAGSNPEGITDLQAPDFQQRFYRVVTTSQSSIIRIEPIKELAILELATFSQQISLASGNSFPTPLTFSLLEGPANLTVTPDGQISWTPNESQGPSTNTITVAVTDTTNPSRGDTNTFTIIVSEVNSAPTLEPALNAQIWADDNFNWLLSANDVDLPANELTYSLISGPANLSVDPSGSISWTPSFADAPSTNLVTVRVTDNATPPLSSTSSFVLYVYEATPEIGFTTASVELPEGDSSTPSTFIYEIYRTGNLTDATSIDWKVATFTGTGNAGTVDFKSASLQGTATFNPGESTTTIHITVSGNATTEADEPFQVELLDHPTYPLASRFAQGTILNDDWPAPRASIAEVFPSGSIPGIYLLEGTGTTTERARTFQITLPAQNSTYQFDWVVLPKNVAGGSSASASDFRGSVFPSGTAIFEPGETQKTIELFITPDAEEELTEGFEVRISSPQPDVLYSNSSTSSTIANDDFAPATYSILPIQDTARDDTNEDYFTYAILRSGDTSQAETIFWAIETSPSDPFPAKQTRAGNTAYFADLDPDSILEGLIQPHANPSATSAYATGGMTFAAYEEVKVVRFKPAHDSTTEPQETFTLRISYFRNGTSVEHRATGTIPASDQHPETAIVYAAWRDATFTSLPLSSSTTAVQSRYSNTISTAPTAGLNQTLEALGLTVGSISLPEGTGTQNPPTQATIDLQLSIPQETDFALVWRVHAANSSPSADPNDFANELGQYLPTYPSGLALFPAGSTHAEIHFYLSPDLTNEPHERFQVTIDPQTIGAANLEFNGTTLQGTISNDDNPYFYPSSIAYNATDANGEVFKMFGVGTVFADFDWNNIWATRLFFINELEAFNPGGWVNKVSVEERPDGWVRFFSNVLIPEKKADGTPVNWEFKSRVFDLQADPAQAAINIAPPEDVIPPQPPIDRTQYTRIYIHGWKDSAFSPNSRQFFAQLKEAFPDDNLVFVDVAQLMRQIHKADYFKEPGWEAGVFAQVGECVADFIIRAEINPDRLTLIGHSNGAHMASRTAKAYRDRTSQLVNELITLDYAPGAFGTMGSLSTLGWWNDNNPEDFKFDEDARDGYGRGKGVITGTQPTGGWTKPVELIQGDLSNPLAVAHTTTSYAAMSLWGKRSILGLGLHTANDHDLNRTAGRAYLVHCNNQELTVRMADDPVNDIEIGIVPSHTGVLSVYGYLARMHALHPEDVGFAQNELLNSINEFGQPSDSGDYPHEFDGIIFARDPYHGKKHDQIFQLPFGWGPEVENPSIVRGFNGNDRMFLGDMSLPNLPLPVVKGPEYIFEQFEITLSGGEGNDTLGASPRSFNRDVVSLIGGPDADTFFIGFSQTRLGYEGPLGEFYPSDPEALPTERDAALFITRNYSSRIFSFPQPFQEWSNFLNIRNPGEDQVGEKHFVIVKDFSTSQNDTLRLGDHRKKYVFSRVGDLVSATAMNRYNLNPQDLAIFTGDADITAQNIPGDLSNNFDLIAVVSGITAANIPMPNPDDFFFGILDFGYQEARSQWKAEITATINNLVSSGRLRFGSIVNVDWFVSPMPGVFHSSNTASQNTYPAYFIHEPSMP